MHALSPSGATTRLKADREHRETPCLVRVSGGDPGSFANWPTQLPPEHSVEYGGPVLGSLCLSVLPPCELCLCLHECSQSQ